MALSKDRPKRSRVAAEASGFGVSLPLLIISLVLLLSVSLFCLISWREYIKAADQTRLSVAIIATLKNEISWLERAETSQQAFLLTLDSRYFKAALRAIPQAATQLKTLDSLNGRRSHGLTALGTFEEAVKDKASDLNATLEQIRESRINAAIGRIKAVRGRLLMDRVRDNEQRLEENEQERLLLARNRSRFYARLSQLVATLGSAGIFAIVLLSTIRIQQLISARAALTAELQRTNQDLRQFVYSASHDLQEPLRNLMIYSDLVEKRVASGSVERLREDVKCIRIFADRMRALVADLLTYTQIASPEPASLEMTNMNEAVAKAIENCRLSIEEASAQITYGSLPRLRISANYAEQLMGHLLSNAIRYRNMEVPVTVRIWAERKRSEWIFAVHDNGIGIDPRYHEHIFGIFKRLHTATEHPGTGLGLAICRKIVERHQGRIWVESEPGVGSIFYFAIPVIAALNRD